MNSSDDQRQEELTPLIGSCMRQAGKKVSRRLAVKFDVDDDVDAREICKQVSGNLSQSTAARLVQTRGTVLITRPRSARRDYKKLATETHLKLQDIRTTELISPDAEGPAIQMPEVQPTFSSNAHHRTDAYWEDLLGAKGKRYPCDWITSNSFQFLCCVAIITNALLLNIEELDSEWCHILKSWIIAFSIVELFLILMRWRAGVVFETIESGVFYVFECIAVTSCAIDIWVLSSTNPEVAETNVSALLRMLWLLRLVRVIQLVPQLHELVHGVLDALQGLFWVLVFMMLLLYATSILCTRLIGHQQLHDTENPLLLQAQKDFQSVGTSFFTLFMIMSSWSLSPLVPAMENVGYLRVAFISFYIFCGWTLLAVMTGNVSFHMMMSKSNISTGDEELKAHSTERLLRMFESIFAELDMDSSGDLCHEEFQIIMSSKELLRTLAQYSNIVPKDLHELWSWLDADGSDCVSVEDFMQALLFLNEPLSQKSVFKMQEKIATDTFSLKGRLRTLINSAFDNLWEEVKQPIKKLTAITEQTQILNGSMSTLCERFGVPPQGYAGMVQEIELPTARTRSAREALFVSHKSVESLDSARPMSPVASMSRAGQAAMEARLRLRSGSSVHDPTVSCKLGTSSIELAQARAAEKIESARPKGAGVADMEQRIRMQIGEIAVRISRFKPVTKD